MAYRLIGLLLVLGGMASITHVGFWNGVETASSTLILGFLLLASYCVGFFGEKIGLPRITGYILAGLLLGPYFLDFYGTRSIEDLHFLNSLALAFIAFCAGGELKYTNIRDRLRPLSFMLTGITVVVFMGVTLSVFVMSSMIPFMSEMPFSLKLAIAAIFGVISTARSPSSAIAIISEVRAKGPFTDTVLSVTVAMDVVIIMLFAIVISFCQVLITPESELSMILLLYIMLEIGTTFVLGFLLGKGIIYLIRNLDAELPVIIAVMGFVVIKFCHSLGEYVNDVHDISLNLEPLLICMAAGFTVQNFSDHGSSFLRSMDNVSVPIYVAFFAITGATINIDILKTGWILGFVVFLVRGMMIYVGTSLSGRLAGDTPKIYKNAWLGFITQAGVSLGLLTEVVRRFPDLGVNVQSILIASITLNQIFGPVAFKYVLHKVGESKN